MLKDFISAMRGGICVVMGNRYLDSQNQSRCQCHGETWAKPYSQNQNQTQSQCQRSIWYIAANDLYGYALMQKLPYKDLSFTNTTLEEISNTPDDRDYGYWLICDLEYTNECKKELVAFNYYRIEEK